MILHKKKQAPSKNFPRKHNSSNVLWIKIPSALSRLCRNVQTYLESVTSTANKPSIDCMLIFFLPIRMRLCASVSSDNALPNNCRKAVQTQENRVGSFANYFFFLEVCSGPSCRQFSEILSRKQPQSLFQHKFSLKLKHLRDFQLKLLL